MTRAAELPALGAVFSFSDGAWAHLQRAFREEWLVLLRSQETPAETRHIETCRQAEDVRRLFHQVRLEECEDDEVAEVYRWSIGGWKLIDRAPAVRSSNLVGDTDWEFVWSQDGQQLGATWSEHPGVWTLRVVDPDLEPFSDPERTEFAEEPRMIDTVHGTRAAAVAAAQAMFPETAVAEDDNWPKTWAEPVNRFKAAGFDARFQVMTQFIGPTEVTCTAPGCTREAMVRIGRSGSDVGAEVRLACTDHAGEALARQL